MDQSSSSSLRSSSKLYHNVDDESELKCLDSNPSSIDECNLTYEEIFKKVSIALAEKIASHHSSTCNEPDSSLRDYLLKKTSTRSQKPSTHRNQNQNQNQDQDQDQFDSSASNPNRTRVHFDLHPVSSIISFTDSESNIKPNEIELPAQSPSPSIRSKPILLPPPIPSCKPKKQIQFPRPYRRRLSIDLKAIQTALPLSPPPQEIPLPDSPKPEFDFSEFENCLNQVGLNLLDNLPMMIERRSHPSDSVMDFDSSKPLIDLEAPTESPAPHKTYTYPIESNSKPSHQNELKNHLGNFSPLPSPTLPFLMSSLVSSPISDHHHHTFNPTQYNRLESVVLSPTRSTHLDLNDQERYVPVNEMFSNSKTHQPRSPRKDKRSVTINEDDVKSTPSLTNKDQSQSKSGLSTPTKTFKRQLKSPLQIIPTVASLWTSTSTLPSPIESLHTPVECCCSPIDPPHTPIDFGHDPIDSLHEIHHESNRSSQNSTPIQSLLGPCTCDRSDSSTVKDSPARSSSTIHRASPPGQSVDLSPLSAPFDHTEHHERENEGNQNRNPNPTSPNIPNPPLPPSPIPSILSNTSTRSSKLKELIQTISKRSKEREKELEEMIKISIEREEEFERLVKLMKEREVQRDQVLMKWACRVPLPNEETPMIRCSNVQVEGIGDHHSEDSNQTYSAQHSTHTKSPIHRSIHSNSNPKTSSIRSIPIFEGPLLSPKAASIHSFKSVQREPLVYSPIAHSIRSASIHSPLGINPVHSPRALSVHSKTSRPKSVNDSMGELESGAGNVPVSINSAGVESPVGIFKSPGNKSVLDSLLNGNNGNANDDHRSLRSGHLGDNRSVKSGHSPGDNKSMKSEYGAGDNKSIRSGFGAGDNRSIKSGNAGGDHRSIRSGNVGGGGADEGNKDNDGMSLRSVRTHGRAASDAGGGGGASNLGGGGEDVGGAGDETNAEVGGGDGGDGGGGGGGGGGDGGDTGENAQGEGESGAGEGNEVIPDTQSVKSGKTNRTKSVKSPSIKEEDQMSIKSSEKAAVEEEAENQDSNEEVKVENVPAEEEEDKNEGSVAVSLNGSVSRPSTIMGEGVEEKVHSMITVENLDQLPDEIGSLQYSSSSTSTSHPNPNDEQGFCIVPSVMNKPGKWVRIGTAGFQFIPT